MDEWKRTALGQLLEMAGNDEAELRDIDRDQYYWALNLLEEFPELDEETAQEWTEDISQLDCVYRQFVLMRLLLDIVDSAKTED